MYANIMDAAGVAVISVLASAVTSLVVRRAQERVAREESTLRELASLRNHSLVLVIRALSRFYWWRLQVLEPEDDSDEAAKRKAAAELERAGRSAVRIFQSRMFLIPHEVRREVAHAMDAMGAAKTGDEVRDIAIDLGNELERFLPRLPSRRLGRAERMDLDDDRRARRELREAARTPPEP